MAETPLPPAATTDPGPQSGRLSGSTKATIGLFILLALLLGLLLGTRLESWLTGDATTPPAADTVDVGFAQDMSVHHAQAVEMSAMALTNAADPAVRNLAYDVVTTQQSQIGTMQGWLAVWDRPSLRSGEPMSWMPAEPAGAGGHSMSGMNDRATSSNSSASMPGMATTDELAELRRMTGPEFDTRYLQLLLRHHQGGIPMAEYAAENAAVPAVTTLAGQIANTQQAESTAIEQLLAAKGAAPLPMN